MRHEHHPLVLLVGNKRRGKVEPIHPIRILEAAIVGEVVVHLHQDDVGRRKGDAEAQDVERGRHFVASEILEELFH